MNRVMLCMVTMAMLGGCAHTPTFSRQRYDTLYTGMPDFEVRSILGKPKLESGDRWEYEHDKPYYKAVIHFHNGFVTKRQWLNDPPHAKVPASAPATQRVEQPAGEPLPGNPEQVPAPLDSMTAPDTP